MENNESSFQSKLSVKGVNIIYLLAILLFVTAGAYVQTLSFNYGVLITEFVIVALPALAYVMIRKSSMKKELRFNRIRFLDALLVAVIFLCSYPVALFFNLIGIVFVSLFGDLIQSPIPIAEDVGQYAILMMLIAGSAGLCEELLFRGLIMRGYERIGKWKSILFTALLFSMMHLNIQNILGPLFLGVLLGYVVYTTNSIFAGMIGHFVNNGISVSLSFLLMQIPAIRNAAAAQQQMPQGAEIQGLIAALVIFGLWAMFSAVWIALCIWALRERNKERVKQQALKEASAIEKQSLGEILRNLRLSWPLYLTLLIFIFFTLVQFNFVITGKPLFG